MCDIGREHQLKLLEVMKVIHEVCVRNNIKYYMLGGTMLGAVRHQGFIPWDDDMDIGLPRKDYEKLLSLPPSEWPSNIAIKTPETSKDLIYPYSKIMDKNTTLVEGRLDGIVGGIYIDVFPLDGAGKSFLKAKINYYKFYWKLGLLYNNQDTERKKTVLRRLVQLYARKQNVNKLFKKADRRMKKISYEDSCIIGNYAGAWGLREFMLKEYIGSPTLYQFEDVMLYGPQNGEAYLRSLYSDYMKLPPKEKQKSHHNYIYINLNESYERYKKK